MTEERGRDSRLAIHLFGSFEVRRCGVALTRVRYRKGHWLLSLLTLRCGREVDRAWLAGTLWPESAHSDSLASLRNCLKDLRNTLGRDAERLYAPQSDTLAFDLAGVHADLLAFDAAIGEGHTASLEVAIALYRGPLIEECTEEWVFAERQLREQQYLAALETLATRAAEGGDLAAAERYLRRSVAVDPLRETAQRSLMKLLTTVGDPAAALQVYRDLQQRLHREFGLTPEAQTMALFRDIESASHRSLRLLSPAESPGTRGPLPPRFRFHPPALPVPPTPLVGRDAELRTLSDLIQQTGAHLITLTGPGGSGKSRLALESAIRLRRGFDEAVWFVPLLDITDPTLIPDRMRAALRLPRASELEPLDQAALFLSGQPSLLLLDNFEQIVEGGAETIRALLDRVEKLTLLVTSRRSLGVAGEQEFPVPPLPLPACGDGPDALIRNDSVRLYTERARAVRPAFQVLNENAMDVARLCEALEGLPLAIELAAARAAILTPKQMLARIESRFELLRGREQSADPRHHSLEAALDWSCQLLTPEVQTFFRRLSVFRGGWTLAAAEQVCDDPMALEYLSRLREHSLLFADELDGEMRYRLLESVREYGAEQLTAAERTAVTERHAAYFLALAEEATAEFDRTWQPAPLDRLEAEHDNLRAALSGAVARGEIETGLRLAAALSVFWRKRGYRLEGRARIEALLALSGVEGHPLLQAKALRSMGDLIGYEDGTKSRRKAVGVIGCEDGARQQWEAALALFRPCGDPIETATCLVQLGHLHRMRGTLAVAQTAYDESLALYREHGHRRGVAAVLSGLGLMSVAAMEWERAKSLLEESMQIFREEGDRSGMVMSMRNLAALLVDEAAGFHQPERAKSYMEASLAIHREIGDRLGAAGCVWWLGSLANTQNDLATARRLWEECLPVLRELEGGRTTFYVLSDLGWLHRRQGEFEQARGYIEESLALARARDARGDITWALAALGGLARDESRWEDARARFREAIALEWELFGEVEPGNRLGRRAHQLSLATYLEGLARVDVAVGNPDQAVRCFAAAAASRDAMDPGRPPTCPNSPDAPWRDVRSHLTPEAFTAAWAKGQAMSLETAIEEALAMTPPDWQPGSTRF